MVKNKREKDSWENIIPKDQISEDTLAGVETDETAPLVKEGGIELNAYKNMEESEEKLNPNQVNLTGLNENTGFRGRRIGSGKRKDNNFLHPAGMMGSTGFQDLIVENGLTRTNISIGQFSRKNVDQLKSIYSQLATISSIDGRDPVINDENLKRKIATVSLTIIQDTYPQRDKILSEAYVLSTFVRYNFGDELDEVFMLASKMLPPDDSAELDVIEMWDRMREILNEYIGERILDST